MKNLPKNAVLILIDIQKGFDSPKWGNRNNLQAEENAARLLEAWRQTKRPIAFIQHLSLFEDSPLRGGTEGSEIKEIVRPQDSEPVFQKHVNSAFIGTDLESWLRENGYQTLVITGLTTPHCVSTTTRMAGNFGFETYLVSDAVAAFDLTGHDGKLYKAEDIHNVSLATLNDEFATIVETDEMLAALDFAKAEHN